MGLPCTLWDFSSIPGLHQLKPTPAVTTIHISRHLSPGGNVTQSENHSGLRYFWMTSSHPVCPFSEKLPALMQSPQCHKLPPLPSVPEPRCEGAAGDVGGRGHLTPARSPLRASMRFKPLTEQLWPLRSRVGKPLPLGAPERPGPELGLPTPPAQLGRTPHATNMLGDHTAGARGSRWPFSLSPKTTGQVTGEDFMPPPGSQGSRQLLPPAALPPPQGGVTSPSLASVCGLGPPSSPAGSPEPHIVRNMSCSLLLPLFFWKLC